MTAAAAAASPAAGAPSEEIRAVPKMPRGRPAGEYQVEALSALLTGSFGAPDTLDILVMRVSYSDLGFTVPPHDSVYFANEMRHLWEYFKGASLGAFGLGYEFAAGVTTLSFDAAYYGDDDEWEERVAEILMEAVAANDDVIDFSMYDAFALIHPGPGQETDFAGDSPWQLWSGFIDPLEMAEAIADTLGTPGIPTNDLVEGDTFYVDNVMVLPEDASQDNMVFGSLGIYAYQVGKRLGMIPMYDTTPSGFPDSQGIGAFGLMGYGLYNAAGFIPAFPCAFQRYLMGWVSPVSAVSGSSMRIADINSFDPGDTSLVRIGISPTEYFLVANRLHDRDMDGRFDFGDADSDGLPENGDTLLGAEFDFFLTATTNPYWYEEIGGEQVKITDTGSGIMIWHVDETVIRNRIMSGGYPNDIPGLSGVDLEEADGVQDLDRPGGTHAYGSWGDSYRNGWYDLFGPGTIPDSYSNTGSPTGIEVEIDSMPGSFMGVTITFGEHLPRVTGEIVGTVMGLSPVTADLDGASGDELVQAADTGKIYIGWGAGSLSWDGAMELAIDVPGAVWSGTPVIADLDGAPPLEILAGSRDGRIHAGRTDGSGYPIDTGSSPGTLGVGGEIVGAPLALEADGDPYDEVVFLVSDGDTTWLYVIGMSHPLDGGFSAGDGVYGIALGAGRLIAHPVQCLDTGRAGWAGIFTALAGPEGLVTLMRVEMSLTGPGTAFTSWNSMERYGSEDLMLPAAGDIDGDGSDDIAMSIPGAGLFYMDFQGGGLERAFAVGVSSPPALADLDEDGVLETLIRDRENLYLITGFGLIVNEWPVRLDDYILALEPDSTPAQPVAADLDGDGWLEAVFNVAGELRVYNRSGRRLEEWTIQAGGDFSITPSFAAGGLSETFIFTAGGSGGISGPDQSGIVFFPGVSTVARIEPGTEWDPEGSWPAYRHDASGSGRQAESGGGIASAQLVDETSLICYPNPAKGSFINVRLTITQKADVAIRLFSLEGTQVYSSTTEHEWSGTSVPFEKAVPTGDLASGIYILHIRVTGDRGDWGGAKKIAIVR